MTAFIDEHRGVYGVEPIGNLLPIAASTYYTQAARRADPQRRPCRAPGGTMRRARRFVGCGGQNKRV
jgi:putative transposase